MTPAEHALWTHLRARRLSGFHFRRQQVINGYIVDFYCHAAGLVIEVDGDIHSRQKEYDKERDNYLQSRGMRVFRLSNELIHNNIDIVSISILDLCQELPDSQTKR